MPAHPRLFQTVLDTTDVRQLAEFYRRLLGMDYASGEDPNAEGADPNPDWLSLSDHRGGRLAFQLVDRLVPTTWPKHDVPMQLHLDLLMEDLVTLEYWRGWAKEHGATELLDRTDDPDEPLVVLADPSGHPFCLFVG